MIAEQLDAQCLEAAARHGFGRYRGGKRDRQSFGRRDQPERSEAANLAYLKTGPSSVLAVAQAFTAMDDAATSFGLLEDYYFGEGQ